MIQTKWTIYPHPWPVPPKFFSLRYWICVAPDRVISSLRNFLLRKQPQKQPWSVFFFAVVCFLLRLFIDYLWFLMSCHMVVLYWLRPTWIPRGNCSADETRRNVTSKLNFLLIFEFFKFQCLNPEEKKLNLAGIPGNCFYNKLCKFWEVLQEQMVWSGWQLYRNFQILKRVFWVSRQQKPLGNDLIINDHLLRVFLAKLLQVFDIWHSKSCPKQNARQLTCIVTCDEKKSLINWNIRNWKNMYY